MLFIVLYLIACCFLYAGAVYAITHYDHDDVDLEWALLLIILAFCPIVNLLTVSITASSWWEYNRYRFPNWTFNPILFKRKVK